MSIFRRRRKGAGGPARGSDDEEEYFRSQSDELYSFDSEEHEGQDDDLIFLHEEDGPLDRDGPDDPEESGDLYEDDNLPEEAHRRGFRLFTRKRSDREDSGTDSLYGDDLYPADSGINDEEDEDDHTFFSLLPDDGEDLPAPRGLPFFRRKLSEEKPSTAADIRAGIEARVRRRRLLIRMAVLSVVLALFGTAGFLYMFFKVRHVEVSGATHYSKEQIESIVMNGFLGDNSLVLSAKYRNKPVTGVPFVESMDVDIRSHDSIAIKVYEKSLAGCVHYLGGYMYFDRDGTVVESSTKEVKGVPEVTGLHFSSIVLNQKLPVKDAGVFQQILDVTQTLKKHGLEADHIYFDASGNMTLYFGDVRAILGESDNMEDKIANLKEILPSLKGKKGSLDMTDFSTDTDYVTFTSDNASDSLETASSLSSDSADADSAGDSTSSEQSSTSSSDKEGGSGGEAEADAAAQVNENAAGDANANNAAQEDENAAEASNAEQQTGEVDGGAAQQ